MLEKLRTAHGIGHSGTYRPSENFSVNAEILNKLKAAQEQERKSDEVRRIIITPNLGQYKGSEYHPSENTSANAEVLRKLKGAGGEIMTKIIGSQGTMDIAIDIATERGISEPSEYSDLHAEILSSKKAIKVMKIPKVPPTLANQTPAANPANKTVSTPPALVAQSSLLKSKPGTQSLLVKKPSKAISILKPQFKLMAASNLENKNLDTSKKAVKHMTLPLSSVGDKQIGPHLKETSRAPCAKTVIASQYNTELVTERTPLNVKSKEVRTRLGASKEEVPGNCGKKSRDLGTSEHAQDELDLLAMNTIANLIGLSDDVPPDKAAISLDNKEGNK